MKDEEMMAVVEDGIKQVSDKVNEKYQVILNGGNFTKPALDTVFENMKEAGTVAVVATDIFALPLVAIEKAMDDSENETYSFMDEGQKKKVKKLMQAVVSECQSVYTSTVPNFDELKENIRKLANGKHEAKEEQS
jgi:hypothetical protein